MSSLSKNLFIEFLAIGLWRKDPAQPLADPRTSEFENPPTATSKLISSRFSSPDIISVI